MVKTTFKRAGVLIAGWAFVLVGIAGLFLPVLQGVLFILIGLFILSSEYIWAHHLLERVRRRFPRVASQLDHAKERGAHWLRRIFGREDPPSGSEDPSRRD
jgi:uncharacterized membrane protein YbaN (DUF454 family)